MILPSRSARVQPAPQPVPSPATFVPAPSPTESDMMRQKSVSVYAGGRPVVSRPVVVRADAGGNRLTVGAELGMGDCATGCDNPAVALHDNVVFQSFTFFGVKVA